METWNQLSGQSDRAEFFAGKVNSNLPKFFLDHAVIKINGMRHKNTILRNTQDVFGNLPESWGILYHLIIDSREPGNKIGDGALRVHQRSEFIHNLISIIFKNGYFGDLVALDSVSRCLYVDYSVQITDSNKRMKLWINSAASKN